MRALLGSWVLACVSVVIAFFFSACGTAKPATQPLGVADYSVSGPYQHRNLTVFLIHGKDTLPGKRFLTLAEAMDQKKVKVHETKDVNNLELENVSDDEVWVQSGDIVKGGQQDRTFANDCIIPPKSGKMSMASFCVESGRWSARGSESAGLFSSSNNSVATKELRRAVQASGMASEHSSGQGEVWKNVAGAQEKLSKSIGSSANASESASSMQLTMEKKEVAQAIEGYTAALEKILADHPDAIGYAAAVNGKVSSVDVYGNHVLFAKLWPKLLNATAVEAVADYSKEKTYAAATPGDVRDTITAAQGGKQTGEKMVANRARLQSRDSDKAMMVECLDAPSAQPVHRSYLTK